MSGRVYYNEIEPYCVEWLKNLMAAGLIPAGEVDSRSIFDVRADDLKGFVWCNFFAGLGGWAYALRLAGWPDDRPAWTGSCPCQPFSLAGKRKGFEDERHLWPVWRKLIAERRPATVFGEQVASASDWLRLVRGDLEALGYAVGAVPVEAASAGAYHKRDRYWFVADADITLPSEKREPRSGQFGRIGSNPQIGDMADADGARSQGRGILPERADEWPFGQDGLANATGERGHGSETATGTAGRNGIEAASPVGFPHRSGRQTGKQTTQTLGHWNPLKSTGGEWCIGSDGKARRLPESGIRLLAHGVPARVGKLRAFGNAIDPRPASKFIEAYMSIDYPAQDGG